MRCPGGMFCMFMPPDFELFFAFLPFFLSLATSVTMPSELWVKLWPAPKEVGIATAS